MWLEGALALMVTELLRVCSFAPPFMMALPRTMGGAPATAGTAGVMLGLPFTGDADEDLPF